MNEDAVRLFHELMKKGYIERSDNTTYLMNYLAIYILFLFFRGEGEDPRIRDFIMKDELISEFNKHCESIVKKDLSEGESKDDFSQNMYMLSEDWLGKKEGLSDSKKIRADDLFYDEGGKLTPSQKTIDLMPYMLRKERIISINNWLEETDNAENQ